MMSSAEAAARPAHTRYRELRCGCVGCLRVNYRNASCWLQPAQLLSTAVRAVTAVFGGAVVLLSDREHLHFLQAVWERAFGPARIFCSRGCHTSQPANHGEYPWTQAIKWTGDLKIRLFPSTLLVWWGGPVDNSKGTSTYLFFRSVFGKPLTLPQTSACSQPPSSLVLKAPYPGALKVSADALL